MKHEYIKLVETWNSGGNVMLDTIWLKSGKVLIISDEVVCKYDSINDFLEDNGDYDYDKNSISLLPDDPKIGKPFVFDGVWITNPLVSECGRFTVVNPIEYYGEAYKNSLK